MTLGADSTFFCPDDAANVFPNANASITQTFAVVAGSSIVTASASVASILGLGSQITFGYTPTPTFAITHGSLVATASASVLTDTAGQLYAGANIVFTATQYTVAAVSVDGLSVTLTAAFSETTVTAATAAVSWSALIDNIDVTGKILVITNPAAVSYAGSAFGTAATLALAPMASPAASATTAAGVSLQFGWPGASQDPGHALGRRIFVGTTGNLVVTMLSGRTVTFFGVQAGSYRDGLFIGISTASTASNITVCK